MHDGEHRRPSDDPGAGFGGVRHRLRYRFDNLLARGTSAVLIWLGVVTLLTVVLSSLLLAAAGVTFSGSNEDSFLEDFWQSLLRTMDPGTMAGDVGWGQRLLALAVTIFGILVAGTLIGVIASGVEARIDRMRRGRSVVIERDHIVILGASQRLPVVVDQLTIAYRKRGGRAIVVMDDRDPSEMVDAVARVVEDTRGSRLVYRSGDPTLRRDLELVRLSAARTVIVLRGADGDVGVVKTVLAIGVELGGFDHVPIVAELTDLSNAEKLERACGAKVHPILASQASARTAAFALREPGMSQVVDELFDFRQCDLYLRDEDGLTGLRFGELVGRYRTARPLGRVRPGGEIELNPPPGTVVEAGDRLIVLAQDRGELTVDTSPAAVPRTHRAGRAAADRVAPEHLLTVGWSEFGAQLLGHWALHSNPASTVEIATDDDLHGEVLAAIEALGVGGRAILGHDDPIERIAHPAGRPNVDTVVFLADHGLDRPEADMRVLLDLAALRSALPAAALPRLVVELRDVDSIALVQLPGADDYIVSEAIASRFIAQLAEQPERRAVFLELYDPSTSSLRIDDVDELGLVGEFEVRTLWAAAYEQGLIAIGWRRSAAHDGEFVLNAPATGRVELRPGDQLVSVG
ncbi:CASTOR/POLLUX-related putative ion channel [Ilumatobacter sp.]|uniref:CASTOR/POLLUX-related putative ion channel n=1 Tax=Ilumatobacter sp. TaxID=1967498 RepID=UPI003AF9AD9A